MKKIFLSLALLAASATAFAIPNPVQIEKALERGNCAQARNLVNEVLAAKPDSARAHLLNSATIMCLEKDPALAKRELDAARELDRKGDVTSSNLFAKMENDIAAAQRPVYTPPVQTYVPPVVAQPAPVVAQPAVVKEESSGFGKFLVFLLLVGIGGGIFWFIRRSKQQDDLVSNLPATGGVVGPDITPASPVTESTSRSWSAPTPAPAPVYRAPRRTYSAPAPAPVYRAPAPAPVVVNNGPSALETGVAVAGGVVAGNMISEALKPKREEYSSRRSETSDGYSTYSSSNPTYSAPAPAPYVAPAPAPSSDDGWGSSSRSSSSWSSSSDDDSSSRSSSSSWSSSSSSDYSSSSSSDYSSSSSSDSSSSSSSDW